MEAKINTKDMTKTSTKASTQIQAKAKFLPQYTWLQLYSVLKGHKKALILRPA